MTLEQIITNDLKDAMRNKKHLKLACIKAVREEILKLKKLDVNNQEVNDKDVLAIIKKLIKENKESLAFCKEAGKEDTAQEHEEKIGFLQAYLPEGFSEEELQGLVKQAIKDNNASSLKDMKTIIQAVKDNTANSSKDLDMGKLSMIAKQELS